MIRKAIAALAILMGLALAGLEAPGLWRDYQIDQSTLTEATEFDPPDGGCSSTLAVFTTCGFAVVHSETKAVTLFDYIHLQAGPPTDTPAVPMQNADKSVLTFSYGLAQLQNRLYAVLLGVILVIAGLVMWTAGRRTA